jgi:hypothetical protein
VKYKIHSDGKTYVHKKGSTKVNDQFKTLSNLGIGAIVKGYVGGEVIMEEVLPLHKCKKSDLPHNIFDSLNKLQTILKSNRLAHCDIKVSNMGFSMVSKELLLIDADDLKTFG